MMTRYVVDGMNVIGARPDGWWRDRDAAVRRLLTNLQHAVERSGDEISLVVDGRPLPDLPEGVYDGVTVRYAARRGRDAADDRIVELVENDDAAGELHVVTSDRALASRVAALGAATEGARSFLRRVERLGD
jgi:predicted RNA-binding protein with PIN domain